MSTSYSFDGWQFAMFLWFFVCSFSIYSFCCFLSGFVSDFSGWNWGVCWLCDLLRLWWLCKIEKQSDVHNLEQNVRIFMSFQFANWSCAQKRIKKATWSATHVSFATMSLKPTINVGCFKYTSSLIRSQIIFCGWAQRKWSLKLCQNNNYRQS